MTTIQRSVNSAMVNFMHASALHLGQLSGIHELSKCVDVNGGEVEVPPCTFVQMNSRTLTYDGQMFVLNRVDKTTDSVKVVANRFGDKNQIFTFFLLPRVSSTNRCPNWSRRM